MSIPSELGHLAVPIDFLAYGKNKLTQASFQTETSRSRLKHPAVAPLWLDIRDVLIYTKCVDNKKLNH